MVNPADTATVVAGVAEALVPALTPFSPLIALMLTAIRAHYNATQTWPTPAQVHAALPEDYQKLHQTWAAWTAAHPQP